MSQTKQKYLMIVEKSSAQLKTSSDDPYVMEGTFTEIGIKNKNNRIYDEKEVLPHIDELNSKISGGKLLGELDHPKNFEISLKNVSHVIESLKYDKATKKVTGRVRLLNTSCGKEAKALVDDGIPLHISSRAAGVVESDGHVKIKKMFTYDLVADPGFANAELKRVNETYGLEDDADIQIYEMGEYTDDEFENLIKSNKVSDINNKNNKQEMSDRFVSMDDFNSYSKILQNEISELKKSLTEGLSKNEDSNSLIKYVETIATGLNNLTEKFSQVEEEIGTIIEHNDYIIESLENVKNYSEAVGFKSNQGLNYSNKLSEGINNVITDLKNLSESQESMKSWVNDVVVESNNRWNYTAVVNETIDSRLQYQEAINETLNKRFAYQDEINEHLDTLIDYTNFVAEGTDANKKFGSYLKEEIQNLVGYTSAIVENLNKDIYGKNTVNIHENKNDNFKSNIEKNLTAIFESAKMQKAVEPNKKFPFLSFLSESKRTEFNNLDETKKEKVIAMYENNSYFGTKDVNAIWESAMNPVQASTNWLTEMPAKYKPNWEALSESRKIEIEAQASMRNLDTQYKVDYFWSTRDLRPEKVESPIINESSSPITSSPAPVEDPRMEYYRQEFRKRFSK